ncbi:hypothetical protein E7T06_14500 [Deinococcus sp. Arct2-2]|uniref:hypothetical protein n=1 Tax=Deinococcus sp. Arct2-2 TaxID=2568653 RepID=UPI0010A34BD3|nr:hypothetical protein [Deinococcus sp. Arct2-2]THF68875.1 hypothetical protein E7T06_14500 [Deinococcus sp. Arct2-2]
MKQTFNHGLGLVLLAGVAWLHYRDIPDKLGETPYLGWMYILLVAGCSAAGAWLLSHQWRSGYGLGLIISVGAIVAYALTRTTGLPNARGDIGNWAEPSGVLALLFEAAFAVLAVMQLRRAGVNSAPHPSQQLR